MVAMSAVLLALASPPLVRMSPSMSGGMDSWSNPTRLRASTSSRASGMGAGGPPKTATALGELRIRTRTALLGLEDRDLATQAQWGVQGLVNPLAAPGRKACLGPHAAHGPSAAPKDSQTAAGQPLAALCSSALSAHPCARGEACYGHKL